MIAARILNPGIASGSVLHLTEPLSFWGGFDPLSGAIVDVHHPQRGQRLTGRIILMASSRGSGTAPGALAESIRRQTGPAALVMVEPDVNLAIGAAVAATLYDRSIPVLMVAPDEFATVATWPAAEIADNEMKQIPLRLVGRG
jgi:predicted aconitase with swiveling domain